MLDFLKSILSEREDKILLFSGIVSCFFSFIEQFTPNFSLQNYPNYWMFLFGIFLLIIYLLIKLRSIKLIKIEKLGKGFKVNIGKEHSIQFVNGNLANVSCNKHEVVVLPVNDTFDSPCLDDARSATGAFIKQHFPTGYKQIFNKLQDERKSVVNAMTIPLSDPLGQQCNLFFTAATELVNGKISSNPERIERALKSIFDIAAEKRFSNIYMPVIGTGHGGMDVSTAILLIVAAFVHYCSKGDCHIVKNLTIVVFNADNRRMKMIRKIAEAVKQIDLK
ncbi:MAG: DUF6430 domain-containing protein [Treponema sp.]|nr:DUF6430 domain-containing protein [Treponema sp.]